jgi:hypothetical protein
MPDFQDLLNMKTTDAVKPPPMPSGTYRVLIDGNEMVKSRDKGTPGCQINFSGFDPMANVDQDRWQDYLSSPAIDKGKITRQETFWLTTKSAYRLKEFCLKAIRHDEEKDGLYESTMGKLIADAMKQTILAEVVQSVSRTSGDVFNEITGYAMDE